MTRAAVTPPPLSPVAVGLALTALASSALGPYRVGRPEVAVLLLLAALLMEAAAHQPSKPLARKSSPALGLAVGSPLLGASWCFSLFLVLRALADMAMVGATARQAVSRLAGELPALVAVAVAQFVPQGWWMVGMAVAYLILEVMLGQRPGQAFRRASEELLWWGLLLYSSSFGPWATLLAVIALLLAKAQPDDSEAHLKEAFSRQISASESTLKASHRKFRENTGRFHEVLSLQGILDDFQGQALLADDRKALAGALVQAVGLMDESCQAAVCRKDGQGLKVLAASEGFSLSDFQPLPPGWSTGSMLRANDEERCFYALTGDLFFLMRVSPDAFERLNPLLEHLLARARLILRILEQKRELGLLLEEKTTALDQLALSQAALLQSEKLAAIGQLAAGVAHELNSPLAAIHLQISMARRRLGKSDTEGVLRSLDVCQESSLAAKEIIRSLLAYSRVAGRQREPVTLADLVQQTTRMLEGRLMAGQVALRLQLAEMGPLLLTAPEIVQILVNIVNNAVDALQSRPSERRLMISSAATDGGQQLVLANNGPPVPEEVLERIFEPFFTTKDIGSGTGLGLSIAYQLARGHGGDLQAANQDGWVRFRLWLPTGPTDPAE